MRSISEYVKNGKTKEYSNKIKKGNPHPLCGRGGCLDLNEKQTI